MKGYTTAYVKAQQWAKSFKITSLRSIWDCLNLTYRQLRALIGKINSKGVIIDKAHCGKSISNMVKRELAHWVWETRKVAASCPRLDDGETAQLEEPSTRISVCLLKGIRWVTCIGFDTYLEAEKFRHWLLDVPFWGNQEYQPRGYRYCTQACTRESERTLTEYEVKVWNIDKDVLDRLIQKEFDREHEAYQKTLKAQNQSMLDEVERLANEYGMLVTCPDFLSFSVKLQKDNRIVGIIGKSAIPLDPAKPYYINLRPNALASRDIPISCFEDGFKIIASQKVTA